MAAYRELQSATAVQSAVWVRLRPEPAPPLLAVARGPVIDVFDVATAAGDDATTGVLRLLTTTTCAGVPGSLAEVQLPQSAAWRGATGGGRAALLAGFDDGRVVALALDALTAELVQVSAFAFHADAVGAGAFATLLPTCARQSGVAGRGMVAVDPLHRLAVAPVFDNAIAIMPLRAGAASDGGGDDGTAATAATGAAAPTPEQLAVLATPAPRTPFHPLGAQLFGHADDRGDGEGDGADVDANAVAVAAMNAATLSLFHRPRVLRLDAVRFGAGASAAMPSIMARGISGTLRDVVPLHGYDLHPVIAVVVERAPTSTSRLDSLRHTVSVIALALPPTTAIAAREAAVLAAPTPELQAAALSSAGDAASDATVLWECDRLPSDTLYAVAVPPPFGGLLVVTVNAVIYVNTRIKVALATNTFAIATVDLMHRYPCHVNTTFHPTAPPVAVSLDGSRAAFVAPDVAMVVARDGRVYSLRLFAEAGSISAGNSLSGGGGDIRRAAALHHMLLLPTTAATVPASTLAVWPAADPLHLARGDAVGTPGDDDGDGERAATAALAVRSSRPAAGHAMVAGGEVDSHQLSAAMCFIGSRSVGHVLALALSGRHAAAGSSAAAAVAAAAAATDTSNSAPALAAGKGAADDEAALYAGVDGAGEATTTAATRPSLAAVPAIDDEDALLYGGDGGSSAAASTPASSAPTATVASASAGDDDTTGKVAEAAAPGDGAAESNGAIATAAADAAPASTDPHGFTLLGVDSLPAIGAVADAALGREARLVTVGIDEEPPRSAPLTEIAVASGVDAHSAVTTLTRGLRPLVNTELRLPGCTGMWFIGTPPAAEMPAGEDAAAPAGGSDTGLLVLSFSNGATRVFVAGEGLQEVSADSSALAHMSRVLHVATIVDNDTLLTPYAPQSLARPLDAESGSGGGLGWAGGEYAAGGLPISSEPQFSFGDEEMDGSAASLTAIDGVSAERGHVSAAAVAAAAAAAAAEREALQRREQLVHEHGAAARGLVQAAEAALPTLRRAADAGVPPAMLVVTESAVALHRADARASRLSLLGAAELQLPPGVTLVSCDVFPPVAVLRCSDGSARCLAVDASGSLRLVSAATSALRAGGAPDAITAVALFHDGTGRAAAAFAGVANAAGGAAAGTAGGVTFAAIARRGGTISLISIFPVVGVEVFTSAEAHAGHALLLDGVVAPARGSGGGSDGGADSQVPRTFITELSSAWDPLRCSDGTEVLGGDLGLRILAVDNTDAITAYALHAPIDAAPRSVSGDGLVTSTLHVLADRRRTAVGARWVRIPHAVGLVSREATAAAAARREEGIRRHATRRLQRLDDAGGWSGWLALAQQPLLLLHHRGTMVTVPLAVSDATGAAGATVLPGDLHMSAQPPLALASPFHSHIYPHGLALYTGAASGSYLQFVTLPPGPATLRSQCRVPFPLLTSADAAAPDADAAAVLHATHGAGSSSASVPRITRLAWSSAAAYAGGAADVYPGSAAMIQCRRHVGQTVLALTYLEGASAQAGQAALAEWARATAEAAAAAGRPAPLPPTASQAACCVRPLYAMVTAAVASRDHAADMAAEEAAIAARGGEMDHATSIGPHRELMDAIAASIAGCAPDASALATLMGMRGAGGVPPLVSAAAEVAALGFPFLAEPTHQLCLFAGTNTSGGPSWQLLTSLSMRQGERVLCVREVAVHEPGHAAPVPTVFVGTAILSPRGEDGHASGRVLALRLRWGASGEASWHVAYEADEPAPVTVMTPVETREGRLLMMGQGKTMKVMQWRRRAAAAGGGAGGGAGEMELFQVGFREFNHWIRSAASVHGFAVYGDVAHSIRFMQWREDTKTAHLLGLDTGRLLLSTLEMLMHEKTLGLAAADCEGNIAVYHYAPRDHGSRLMVRADYHVGATVTRFLRSRCAYPPATPTASRKRFCLLTTCVDGSIGGLVPLEEEPLQALTALAHTLQAVSAAATPAVGAPPGRWRAFRSCLPLARDAAGRIIDWNAVVAALLALPQRLQREVAATAFAAMPAPEAAAPAAGAGAAVPAAAASAPALVRPAAALEALLSWARSADVALGVC